MLITLMAKNSTQTTNSDIKIFREADISVSHHLTSLGTTHDFIC